MLDKKINSIHTPCKSCVFAIYNDKTQEGCAIDYIEKYKINNVEILEAYDNEKEFFIINNKKCIGYRENKWFKQFDLDNADITAKINKYNETNCLDYFLIIDLKTLDMKQLDGILKQINLSEIKPKKVILIRHIDNELNFGYQNIEGLFKENNVTYQWRIQTILDRSLTNEQIIHNTLSLNTKYRFAIMVSKNNEDVARIINTTNKLVHHDLKQFDVISNKNYSCIVFSTLIYRFEIFHNKNILQMKDNYTIV